MAKPQGAAQPINAAEIDVESSTLGAVAKRLGVDFTPAAEPTSDDGAGDDDGAEDEGAAAGADDDEETDETEAAEGAEGAEAKETDAEEADEGEEQEEETDEGDDEASDDVDLRKLPADQRKRVQKILDARIGKITAKTRAELEQAQQRAATLEGELAQARANGGGKVVVEGIHPLLLAESESDIASRLKKIEELEDWCDDNAAGVNLGEDADPAKQSFTPEQIKRFARDLRKEREQIVPQARDRLQKMRQVDGILKDLYPTALDPKHKDYADIQAFARQMPQVRQFYDWKIVLVQQLLGRTALEKLMADKKAKKTNPPAAPAPKKKVPRAPGAGGPAKGGIAERKPGKPAASEAVTRYATDRSRSALTSAVASLIE